jgi:hypothetical protein
MYNLTDKIRLYSIFLTLVNGLTDSAQTWIGDRVELPVLLAGAVYVE